MGAASARLELRAPDGSKQTIPLNRERLTIGRPEGAHARPDLPLHPELPDVSRLHCVLEREGAVWWLRDVSAHGTFVRRGKRLLRMDYDSRERLFNGDVIRIRARSAGRKGHEPVWWEMEFRDPFGTTWPPPDSPTLDCVEWDSTAKALFRLEDGRRLEVRLAPQHRMLVAHMARRSRELGGGPVACDKRELSQSVWPGTPTKELELRRLIKDLRERLEPDREPGTEWRLLQTVQGEGYRLNLCAQGMASP